MQQQQKEKKEIKSPIPTNSAYTTKRPDKDSSDEMTKNLDNNSYIKRISKKYNIIQWNIRVYVNNYDELLLIIDKYKSNIITRQ